MSIAWVPNLLILLLLTACAALLAPLPAVAAPLSFTVRVERPVGGWVNPALAKEAALAAARREAAALAAPVLAQTPEVSLWLGESAAENPERAQLLELASRFLLDAGEPLLPDPGPEDGHVLFLEQSFTLGEAARLRQKLTILLSAPALLENYRLALQMEQECLARYDAAAAELLAQPGRMRPGPAASREKSSAGAAWQETMARHNALRACALYLEILPDLYKEEGLAPELLEPLEEINRLAPGSYLFLSELGRFYLWLERSGQAGQCLDAALRLNPDFDQAYGHRGALWLLLHKPSLALADFDRAIRLSDGRPEMEAVYRHGRAVVWKALGNSRNMCADLRQSCLLGQCAAYEWAVAGQECK